MEDAAVRPVLGQRVEVAPCRGIVVQGIAQMRLVGLPVESRQQRRDRLLTPSSRPTRLVFCGPGKSATGGPARSNRRFNQAEQWINERRTASERCLDRLGLYLNSLNLKEDQDRGKQ